MIPVSLLQVLTTSFKEAFAADGFLKMADITLVPFGNAKESPSTDPVLPYDFSCQHGPSECRYNAVEACALSKIGCPYKAFAYINCIENYDEDRTPDQNYGLVVGACAALTGVADLAADIEECSTGTEGNGLVHDNAVKTSELDPPHTYVPWIVVGGQHSDDLQEAISESLLKYICENYHGPDKSLDCEAFEVTDAGKRADIRGGAAAKANASIENKKKIESRCMAMEDSELPSALEK